ncbi:hypothetical protein EHM76_01495 [bacterium]|nr:MAG: hypothetical protein EHM76_01495 [bacterium]
MSITVEYRFADQSSHQLKTLSQSNASAAVQDFPWDQQLALFNQGDQAVGPEVRFTRSTDTHEGAGDVEAYASIAKTEDGTWLIVAGSTMPSRFLGFFPITRKADIIMDGIAWEDVQNFIKSFYQDTRADLFAWMQKQG